MGCPHNMLQRETEYTVFWCYFIWMTFFKNKQVAVGCRTDSCLQDSATKGWSMTALPHMTCVHIRFRFEKQHHVWKVEIFISSLVHWPKLHTCNQSSSMLKKIFIENNLFFVLVGCNMYILPQWPHGKVPDYSVEGQIWFPTTLNGQCEKNTMSTSPVLVEWCSGLMKRYLCLPDRTSEWYKTKPKSKSIRIIKKYWH